MSGLGLGWGDVELDRFWAQMGNLRITYYCADCYWTIEDVRLMQALTEQFNRRLAALAAEV